LDYLASARRGTARLEIREPSHLQAFVRNARRTLLDPIIATLDLSEDEHEAVPSNASNVQLVASTGKKQKNPATGLTVVHRVRGPNGLFLPRESSDQEPLSKLTKRKLSGSGIHELPLVPNIVSAAVSDEPSAASCLKKSTRDRRPSTKVRDAPAIIENDGQQPQKKRVKIVPVLPVEDENTMAVLPTSFFADDPKDDLEDEKHKPESYKQNWSVSEQHQLEQLLKEYPDGEHQRYSSVFLYWSLSHEIIRWKKISRAMGGRRTPRQVASRVQKLYEKLKRAGVDAEY
jgi:hypothetical protein